MKWGLKACLAAVAAAVVMASSSAFAAAPPTVTYGIKVTDTAVGQYNANLYFVPSTPMRGQFSVQPVDGGPNGSGRYTGSATGGPISGKGNNGEGYFGSFNAIAIPLGKHVYIFGAGKGLAPLSFFFFDGRTEP